jgi:hypothetical protein
MEKKKNTAPIFRMLTSVLLLALLPILPAFPQENVQFTMPTPRFGMCSAQLGNVIYLIGGSTSLSGESEDEVQNLQVSSAVEAFNLDSLAWYTNIAPLNTARFFACSAVADSQIYVMGGKDSNGDALNSVEKYDPVQNKWTFVASMVQARQGAAAVTVGDSIYVFGGASHGNLLDDVEVYSVTNNTWTTHSPMLTTRAFHFVFRYRNMIYIIGGLNRLGPLKVIERYPLSGNMNMGSLSMFTARVKFGALVVHDSVLIIISGMGPTGAAVRNAEEFDGNDEATSLASSVSANLHSARYAFVAAMGSNNIIYLFGGLSPDYKSGSAPVPVVDQVSAVTSVPKSNPLKPIQFSMNQNFPNPFNPSTRITFETTRENEPVRLSVFNMIGQEIQVLVDNPLPPGEHTIEFNGSELPSGVYFYQLSSPEGTLTKRMVLLK